MNESITAGYDLLYLSLCALEDKCPDAERVQKMNKNLLFQMCQSNNVTALVSYTLEKAGLSDSKWLEAKGKAIRKNLLLDAEREKITSFMDKEGIKYMPLKGIVLKDLYPKLGMRQMSDNDIWYDEKYCKELELFMQKLGYNDNEISYGNHDCYKKQPVYNFEMHRTLFYSDSEPFYSYYLDLDRLLIKNSSDSNEFRFSIEDFYVYMVAHEYKHFSNRGTGIRSVFDCFVYLKKYGDKLDFTYIEDECKKISISDFEQKQRKLCQKLSSCQLDLLNDPEREMLEYCFLCGTYGKGTNIFINRLKEYSDSGEVTVKAKFKYFLMRVFPPLSFYKEHYPFFYKHKVLLPIGFFMRLFKGVFKNSSKLKAEIQVIQNQ